VSQDIHTKVKLMFIAVTMQQIVSEVEQAVDYCLTFAQKRGSRLVLISLVQLLLVMIMVNLLDTAESHGVQECHMVYRIVTWCIGVSHGVQECHTVYKSVTCV
jgi:hypothetical protein